MTTSTQLEGFDHIEAKLPECEGEVLAFIRRNPGVTRNEIDAALGAGQPNASHSRRLSGLEEKGWIERGPERACGVSGRPAATWWPVKGEPRPKPKTTKPDPVAAFAARIEDALRGPGPLFPDPRIEKVRAIVEEARAGRATT